MVAKSSKRLQNVLDRLERYYGKPNIPRPADPYEMILYTNCGYPATDASCTKGFEALKKQIGLQPDAILAATHEKLTAIMRLGGSFPELRAERLREIAARVKREFGGDLKAVLKKPLPETKKMLKKFPTIGDPGVDKVLLFTRTGPVAAVPSNAVHVPLRLGFGEEKKNYAGRYRSAQDAIRSDMPASCDALIRAYILLKQHGQALCKRARPLCEQCPVSSECVYYGRITKCDSPSA